MSTAATIRADAVRTALERLLAPVDPAWEKSIVDAYVAQAHGQMKRWTEYLSKPAPKFWRDHQSVPQYVVWTKPADEAVSYKPVDHADHQKRLKAGQYSADVKAAKQDGKHQYHLIREAFLLRVGETIENVIQGQRASIVGEIGFGRAIEGYITVTTKPSKPSTSFRLKVSVKTNYRYGHNSANGNLTVYSQYPVLFDAAQVNGEAVYDRLSEALLANLISGIPVDRKERATAEQKAAKEALSEEKRRLVDLKVAYYAIADDHSRIVDLELSLRPSAHQPLDAEQRERFKQMIAERRENIAERCTRLGITDPGSKAAARALQKAAIAKLKQLRAKA